MTDDFRTLLGLGQVIHAPGVSDPLSALLAIRAGHRAVHLSGAALAAGRPGAGMLSGYEIADRAATLSPVLGGVPLLADAGAGFDDESQAVWAALALSRAGVAALVLPFTPAISALAEQVPQLTLIVRITEYAESGLYWTISRARAAAAAGAHVILPAGVHSPADLERLHLAVPGVHLAVDRSEPGFDVPGPELAAAGVRLALHPMTALLAAMRAASVAYHEIADEGRATHVDQLPRAVVDNLLATATPDTPPPAVPRPAGPRRAVTPAPGAGFRTNSGPPAPRPPWRDPAANLHT